MPSVTALELVNEVLRLHRFDAVENFSDSESLANEALLLVNKGIEQVLNAEDWDFATRHDGVLFTHASLTNETGSGAIVTNGSTSVTFATAVDSSLSPSFVDSGVTRFMLTGDASYSNTPFRLVTTTALTPPIVTGTMEVAWPGTTAAAPGNAYRTFAAEYVLPDTVRKVLSVQYHEQTLPVYVVHPSARLSEIIPSVHENIGGNPEWVAVGGSAVRTYTSAEGSQGQQLRMVVFPVPDSRFRLDYSYVEKYGQLSDPTDTLDIGSDARHKLVDWAYAQSNLTAIGNDPRLGAALKQDLRNEMARARSARQGSAAGHRATIAPMGSGGVGRRRFNEPIDGSDLGI